MLEVVATPLGNALKDTPNLFKDYVTGCLRISYQSIFTGTNNFSAFGPQNETYPEFIGFIRNETRQLFRECCLEDRLEDAEEWYGGCKFVGNDMLYPWSVMNFLHAALKSDAPAAFWPKNYQIGFCRDNILETNTKVATANTFRRLRNLPDGMTEVIAECEFTAYPDIWKNHGFDVFATMMPHNGYLTVGRNAPTPADTIFR